jgi:hypothetical protein
MDVFSKKVFGYSLKLKDGIKDKFRKFKLLVENGLKHQMTLLCRPQQNGVAE